MKHINIVRLARISRPSIEKLNPNEDFAHTQMAAGHIGLPENRLTDLPRVLTPHTIGHGRNRRTVWPRTQVEMVRKLFDKLRDEPRIETAVLDKIVDEITSEVRDGPIVTSLEVLGPDEQPHWQF